MSKQVMLFAGTTEGKRLAHFLAEHGIPSMVCVATSYGEALLEEVMGSEVTILKGEMAGDTMIGWMKKERPQWVIDATHPYATLATQTIYTACQTTQCQYIRVERLRVPYEEPHVIEVEDMIQAVAYLKETKGNVLLTTGSKEIGKVVELLENPKRMYARILPCPQMLEKCLGYGLLRSNMICMQGPFSEAMNTLMLRELNIQYLVTKESGHQGGFLEKVQATHKVGATLIVIKRPMDKEGMTVESVQHMLLSYLYQGKKVGGEV